MRVGEETEPGRTIGTFKLELGGPLPCGLGEAGSGNCRGEHEQWAQKWWGGGERGAGNSGRPKRKAQSSQERDPWGSPFAILSPYNVTYKLAIPELGLHMCYNWAEHSLF